MMTLANTLRTIAAGGYTVVLVVAIRDWAPGFAMFSATYLFLALAFRGFLCKHKNIFIGCFAVACIPALLWLVAFAVAILQKIGIIWTDPDVIVVSGPPPIVVLVHYSAHIISAFFLPASMLASCHALKHNPKLVKSRKGFPTRAFKRL